MLWYYNNPEMIEVERCRFADDAPSYVRSPRRRDVRS